MPFSIRRNTREKPLLDIYAERVIFGKYLLAYSFIDFYGNFKLTKDINTNRRIPETVRAMQNLSSIPDDTNFDQFCENEILKQKSFFLWLLLD